ncbi:hypothetical protein [Sulfitobacter sp.]|uniref:hypothetical protein n=1 Tax=Sulfitobacter sp. TaxID=1903071 RepID=UPI003EF88BAE
MNHTNPEHTATALEYNSAAEINRSDNWLFHAITHVMIISAGAIVEAQQLYVMMRPYFVNNNNEVVGLKLVFFGLTLVGVMMMTAAIIHFALRIVYRFAPRAVDALGAIMGLLVWIAAILIPFVVYLMLSGQPIGGSSGTTHGMLLLRMPIVGAAIFIMGLHVFGVQRALKMKREVKNAKQRRKAGTTARENFEYANHVERTADARATLAQHDVSLEVAEAVALSYTIRGDYAIKHAQGHSIDSFERTVAGALEDALDAFDDGVRSLVEAAMPAPIAYETLPSGCDMTDADRHALIDHGLAMKSLSINKAYKEIKQCA